MNSCTARPLSPEPVGGASMFSRALRYVRDRTSATKRPGRGAPRPPRSARAEALGIFAGGLDPAAVTSPLVAEDGGPGQTSRSAYLDKSPYSDFQHPG